MKKYERILIAALPWICIGIAIALCAEQVRLIGAKKIYLCAGSAENTIAFHGKMGCVLAAEPDRKLVEEDPRDIQLEYTLGG